MKRINDNPVMRSLDATLLGEGQIREVAIWCRAPGCSQRTRKRKPYCTEHIHYMPQVARILAREAGVARHDVVRAG